MYKTIRKTIVYLLCMLLVPMTSYATGDKPVMGSHAKLGLSCEVCHQTSAPTKRAPVSACTGCHGDYSKLAGLTQDVMPNIHASHQGELRCSLCHRAHSESVLYCNECHSFDIQPK